MKGFDEPSVRHRLLVDGNAICMNYSRRRRFFSTLRGRTRANRRQHSIIPFVLASNEIVRISWIVCSMVIAGSPRTHYLRSPRFCSPVCTYHPLLFFFSYFITSFPHPRIDVNRLEGIFTIDQWRQRERMKKTNLCREWKWCCFVFFFFFSFSRDEFSVFYDHRFAR